MKSKIIAILLLLSVLIATIPVNTLAAETDKITTTITDFPEIVQKEINENGYIRRKFHEEPDLYSLIFENSDGTETMRVFSHPVKYIGADGKVNDILLTLQKGENGYVPQSHSLVCLFPNNLSEGVSININEYKVTTFPLFADNACANFDSKKNSVRYDYDDKTSIESILMDNPNNPFLTYTEQKVGDWKFTYLTIDEIITNSFTGISPDSEIVSKTKFTEDDIAEARILVTKINDTFGYKINSNEKLEKTTRQIIKNDKNQLGIFDIYEVLFEIDNIKHAKNVYVNLITGEIKEEFHVLREN